MSAGSQSFAMEVSPWNGHTWGAEGAEMRPTTQRYGPSANRWSLKTLQTRADLIFPGLKHCRHYRDSLHAPDHPPSHKQGWNSAYPHHIASHWLLLYKRHRRNRHKLPHCVEGSSCKCTSPQYKSAHIITNAQGGIPATTAFICQHSSST